MIKHDDLYEFLMKPGRCLIHLAEISQLHALTHLPEQ
jgi:hypothetical protein